MVSKYTSYNDKYYKVRRAFTYWFVNYANKVDDMCGVEYAEIMHFISKMYEAFIRKEFK